MAKNTKANEYIWIWLIVFGLISGTLFLSYAMDVQNKRVLHELFDIKQNEVVDELESKITQYQHTALENSFPS